MWIRSSAMCCNVELAGRIRPCFCSRCTQSPTETFGTISNPEDQKGSSMAKCFPHPVLPVLCVTRCEHLLSPLLLYSVQNWRLLGSSPGDPSPTVTDLLQRDTRMKMRTTMTWEIWGIQNLVFISHLHFVLSIYHNKIGLTPNYLHSRNSFSLGYKKTVFTSWLDTGTPFQCEDRACKVCVAYWVKLIQLHNGASCILRIPKLFEV